MANDPLYKVHFFNQDKVYEIYAQGVHESGLNGFIEIEDLQFGEKSAIIADPSEEKLKAEFADVSCTLVPILHIIRIDIEGKKGSCKIVDAKSGSSIMPFPVSPKPKNSAGD